MERRSFARRVLAANGIVDIGCAAVLVVLPLLKVPVLGYDVFDVQGAFMAGGWGVATLALGLGRLLAASRPASHPVMIAMGLIEGTALALFSLLYVALAGIPVVQAALPLAVGAAFAALYAMISFAIPAVPK
jgi:hypothetical protein